MAQGAAAEVGFRLDEVDRGVSTQRQRGVINGTCKETNNKSEKIWVPISESKFACPQTGR